MSKKVNPTESEYDSEEESDEADTPRQGKPTTQSAKSPQQIVTSKTVTGAGVKEKQLQELVKILRELLDEGENKLKRETAMKILESILNEVTRYDQRFPYRPEMHAKVVNECAKIFV
jgi:hypothetical protein